MPVKLNKPIRHGDVEIVSIDDEKRIITAIVYVYCSTLYAPMLLRHCQNKVAHVIRHYLVPEQFITTGTVPWKTNVTLLKSQNSI
jgi:hypothetical protein